jgi:hypothetical protein
MQQNPRAYKMLISFKNVFIMNKTIIRFKFIPKLKFKIKILQNSAENKLLNNEEKSN